MKFKIVKNFAQVDRDFQDKTKSETGVWEYVTENDERFPVEANACYFIKSYTELGDFNIAISDKNKEVKFLFHNTRVGDYEV